MMDRMGRQAAVHAQVSGGMGYVHLAGPTPAEAVAAGRPQQRQAAGSDKNTKKAAARVAVAGAWAGVVRVGGSMPTLRDDIAATDRILPVAGGAAGGTRRPAMVLLHRVQAEARQPLQPTVKALREIGFPKHLGPKAEFTAAQPAQRMVGAEEILGKKFRRIDPEKEVGECCVDVAPSDPHHPDQGPQGQPHLFSPTPTHRLPPQRAPRDKARVRGASRMTPPRAFVVIGSETSGIVDYWMI